jgi:hypothetical protein
MSRSLRTRDIRTGHPEHRAEGGASGGLFEERAKRSGVATEPSMFGRGGLNLVPICGDNLPWIIAARWGGCMRYGIIATFGQMRFSNDAILDVALARPRERTPDRPSSRR